jgi:enterochelin esterase family protein
MLKTNLILLVALFLWLGCTENDEPEVEQTYKTFTYRTLNSLNELELLLDSINSITGTEKRTNDLQLLWDSLKVSNDIPFVRHDSVLFLYKGSGSKVQWAGDFNGWSPTSTGFTGQELDSIPIWKLKRYFPSDARLDYKIVVNGSTWKLDPANNYVQYSGFGPNSELRMGDWESDPITFSIDGSTSGELSDWKLIYSENLAYTTQYKIYIPYGYSTLENLPVIYVTDGHEYSDNRLGNMITVLDNLIYLNKITPIMAVFVDPRDPNNLSENRRMNEYAGNSSFADYLADELKLEVDAQYKTDQLASSTAILGTSMGGWNSAFVGFTRSDKFNLIGIHSPAFREQSIFNMVENSDILPLQIFMSTGVIHDTEDYARQMETIFSNKGYNYQYIEVNEGHSWGNWRALLDEPLIFFFGTGN